ncbi:MAG TPA: hypothetical protein VHT04_05140 [Stellaceae bacterium]|nr:hypothetical protein [Stellaceae bacterium]
MSTFEHVALQQALPYGLNDPLTVGLPRRLNRALAHLRSEPGIVRLAVCYGFAGAVVMQVGLFSLFAQLVLTLDASVLPSVEISAYCFVLGAVVMVASRSLSAPRLAVSFP